MSFYINLPAISFILSLGIALIIIPVLIKLAESQLWFDQPDERKHHVGQISSLGGIAILVGAFVPLFVFTDWPSSKPILFLSFASMLLATVGFFDDLNGMKALQKLSFQLICGALIFAGGWSVESIFFFIVGIHLPIWLNFIMTVFFIATLINAFNFIDGIDGLAGTLGVINGLIFGALFLINGHTIMAVLALSIAGSCLGFLRFNFHNAKLFMGDCGSMFIGLMTAIMCMHVFQVDILAGPVSPMFALSFWLLPVFDLMRVALGRMYKKRSPFSADRTHVHHILLASGLSTVTACLFLGGLHLALATLVYQFGMAGVLGCGMTYFIFISGFQYLGQAKSKSFSKSVLRRA